MWVCTNGKGLIYYHREMDRFIRILHDPTDSSSLGSAYINDIFEDQEGTLWVASQGGLYKMLSFDPQSEKAQFEPVDLGKVYNIVCLNEFPKGTLWLGTGRLGLIQMNIKSLQTVYHRNEGTTSETSIPSNLIKSFYNESHKYLWVCTHSGISRISKGENQQLIIQSIYHDKTDSLGLPFPFIHNICKTSPGVYWMSTNNGGIIRMNWQRDARPEFEQILHKENAQNTLASNVIYYVFHDKSGNLWLTSDKGINKLSLGYQARNRKAFKHYQIPSTSNLSLKDVLSLYEDENGNIWTGSYGSGLFIFHKKTQKWIRFTITPNSKKRLSSPIITSIIKDKNGIYWIGTFGGLNRVSLTWDNDRALANIKWYLPDPDDPQSLSNKRIFAVHDQDSLLWIGSRGGGLSKFDKRTERFTHFLHQKNHPHSISDNHVWSIQEDSKHRLWLATDKGLNIFRPDKKSFFSIQFDPSKPYGLSANLCNLIYRDSKNRMWIGYYSEGISVINEDDIKEGEEVRFSHISQREGLINPAIYGILEDNEGYFWFSTPSGISRFNTNGWDVGMEVSINAFQNFTKEDGLQDNEFNSGAYHKNKDGWLYFGGINGFNKFHPSDISRNKTIPPVFITSIQIMKKEVKPGSKGKGGHIALDKNPNDEGILNLTHKDLVLDLEFSALNYVFPEKNQYAYKLEGFDQEWIYSGNEQRATYTNLREGKYTFRVRASNNDGVWNETGLSLPIHVSPPPWRSWWAYMLYLLGITSFIGGYIRSRIRSREKELETHWRINQAKLEEREMVRKNAAADFHDELGNKITKISLFVELAKRQAQMGKETATFLDKINIQSRELSEGIRDFIWVLDPDQDTYYKIFNRAKEFGDQLFEHTSIDFRVKGISSNFEDIAISVSERRHLLMIIKEVLHNTLKYALAKSCTLQVATTETHVRISISDDGIGFNPEEVSRGYGLNNIIERAKKIGAKCQIVSSPGKGTQVKMDIKYLN